MQGTIRILIVLVSLWSAAALAAQPAEPRQGLRYLLHQPQLHLHQATGLCLRRVIAGKPRPFRRVGAAPTRVE